MKEWFQKEVDDKLLQQRLHRTSLLRHVDLPSKDKSALDRFLRRQHRLYQAKNNSYFRGIFPQVIYYEYYQCARARILSRMSDNFQSVAEEDRQVYDLTSVSSSHLAFRRTIAQADAFGFTNEYYMEIACAKQINWVRSKGYLSLSKIEAWYNRKKSNADLAQR